MKGVCEYMRTVTVKAIAWLLLVTLCLSLAACSRVPTLEYANGQYTNPKTNISYVPVPRTYEAIAYLPDAVMKIKPEGLEEILLYAVEGLEGNTYLCNASYELFAAAGSTLPAFSQLQLTRALVTQSASISMAITAIGQGEDLTALYKAYAEGPSFPKSEILNQPEKSYRIKFEASNLPGMYYTLAYRQFAEEILLYESLPDGDLSKATAYPGFEVTREEYRYTDQNGVEQVEILAVYHMGKGFLYDTEAGRYYPVGAVIAEYLD